MEKKGKSVHKNLLARHKKVMSERHKLQMSKWYYETRCKELEAERKQLKHDIAQLGMLLDVKLEKVKENK